MSKAYQAGKLKYKKIADQEGDHLGWELLNCYKDLISSQIQCNQFEDAMKTFKKMKLYKLDSMNPRDVQDCIDSIMDDFEKSNKKYRNQSSFANDFLHYHVFGVLFGLKAQALYGLGKFFIMSTEFDKTFQIEDIIALTIKMDLIFYETC